MATHHNGYSSDCGAPGAQPYNYHFANKDETSSSSSDQSSSHLSFLYDRAQGNSYAAAAAAAAIDTSTASNKTHGRYISAETDKRENCREGGEGVARATPAPSYPYTPSQNIRQHSSPEESMACPSGTTPSSSSSSVNPQSKDADVIHRQMSELKIPQQRNCASVTSSQSSKGHEGNGSTRPRVIGGQGVVYKCPAATQHVDPRRNHVRQSIPWKDINSARKFSVPINFSRSRVQMTEFSVDDQTTKGRAPADDPWSPPRPLAGEEVDKTSVRHLLREGDEIGNYDQTSIRYTGKTNPSKSFRLLQSVTGSSDSLSIEHHQAERKERRRQKREEMLPSDAAADGCCEGLKDADDVVDISYIGSKIPSRTFRSLQEAIGARDHQVRPLPSPSVGAFHNYGDCSSSFDLQPMRTVKVIHLRPQKSLENLIGDF